MTTCFQGSIVSTDQAFSNPLAPAALWEELVRGRARVHDHYFDQEWMALRIVSVDKKVALSNLSQTILNQTFSARAQKVVSIQRGIAPSTVTGALRRALSHLGLECAPSRMPVLLQIIAEAGLIGAPVPNVVSVEQRVDTHLYTTILLHDPSAWLLARLSAGEAAVTRLRLHGTSLEAISSSRGRAVRTIANQLAAAYRKLHVSSRSDLLAMLISEYLQGTVPPPNHAPSAPLRPSRVYQVRPRDAQPLDGPERAATG
jgi:DNA-binding CsgD family transcriptional regulator